MHRISQLADRHPVWFVLLTILFWMILAGTLAGLAAFILQASMTSDVAQSIGTLSATAILLLGMWRLGWLKPAGITNFSTMGFWLVTLGLLTCQVLIYWWAFFGSLSVGQSILANPALARSIGGRQIVVGFVEETLFRGVILYALARVWGKTKQGIFGSLVLSAFLFGAIHILQGIVGAPLDLMLLVSLEAFVSGFWWGALVLVSGSLWPTVLMHTVSNASVLIVAASRPGFALPHSGYLWASLLELPLVLLGIYLLIRK